MDGTQVRLTAREHALLAALVAHEGQAVARDVLLTDVFGFSPSSSSRAVDDTMKRLRAKLERQSRRPDHLLTVHGVGYRFRQLSGAATPSTSGPPPLRLRFPGRVVDLDTRTIVRPRQPTRPLSGHEAAVLRILARAAPGWVDRGDLRRAAWGRGAPGRALPNLLSRLRAKLGEGIVLTRRGLGVRLASTLPAPRDLPPRPSPVFGRAAIEASLDDALQTHTIVTLWGAGGTGKTTLAVRAAHRHAESTTVVFVDLHGVPTVEGVRSAVGEALAGPLGDARGVDVVSRLSHIASSVVVLDDLGPAGCTELLQEWSSACPQVRWLVTARQRLGLASEWVVEVPSLEPEPSRALLEARLGPSAEDAAVLDAIAAALGGHPLALHLAAGSAVSCGPREVLRRLEHGGLSWLAAPLDRMLVGAFADLSPALRAVLCRISALDGAWDPDLFAGVSEADVAVLDALRDASWVQRQGRTLSVGPVVRDFVRRQPEYAAQAPAARAANALARWGDWVPVGPIRYRMDPEALRRVRAVAVDLQAGTRCPAPEVAARCLLTLEPLWAMTGRSPDCLDVLHRLDRAHLTDELRVRLACAGVRATRMVGTLEQTLPWRQAGLASLHRADPVVQGLFWMELGQVGGQWGAPEEAVEHFAAAEACFTDAHDDLSLALLCAARGTNLIWSDRPAAVALLRRARGRLARHSVASARAFVDYSLGYTLFGAEGPTDEAAELLAQGSAWFELQGIEMLAAWAQLFRGTLLAARGQSARARALLTSAAARLAAIDNSNGVASARLTVALVDWSVGDMAMAREAHADAADRGAALEHPLLIGMCAATAALLKHGAGDLDGAAAQATAAVELATLGGIDPVVAFAEAVVGLVHGRPAWNNVSDPVRSSVELRALAGLVGQAGAS